jgi:hypothetical protein
MALAVDHQLISVVLALLRLRGKPLLAESSQISLVNPVIVNQICPKWILVLSPFVSQGAEVTEIHNPVAGKVRRAYGRHYLAEDAEA